MAKTKRTIKSSARVGTLTPARARSAVEVVSRGRPSKTDGVGVTFNQSVEGNVIAEVMEQKEGVEITHFPAMIRIDADDRLEFDLAEIQEALGEVDEFTAYDFQIEMATHYGRKSSVSSSRKKK